MRYMLPMGAALIMAAIGCGKALEPVEMVPLEKLPEAVITTAKEKLPDVKFDSAWKENEKSKGEDVYEVRGKTASGKTRDVKVSSSGKILEVD